jgi:hypothetical protein
MAEIADKFTRNEIMTSNEIRGYLGIPPSSEPRADSLANPNMPQKELAAPVEQPALPATTGTADVDIGAVLDQIDAEVDKAFDSFGG